MLALGGPGLLAALTLLVAVGGALAYFTTTGTGSSSASVGGLTAPQSPSASTSGTNVSVTWNAATLNGSLAASSYNVERYTGSGSDLGAASCSPVASSSGTPNAFGSFTCTDSPPTGASYEYKITGNYHTAWSTTSGFTNAVTVKSVTSTTGGGPGTGTTGSAIPTSSILSALSGATASAGGTITFTVFGPQASAPSTCTSGGTTVGSAITVSGNGTYHPSSTYTPSAAGTYWWYASYGGDTFNNTSSSTCGSLMASTVVTNATTTTTTAPGSGTAGSAITAASIGSTLSGATAAASGTISFSVYGPQASAPTTCTGAGWTTVGSATVNGNATYHPGAGYTPTQAGTYWWYASYDGDTANSGSASTCGTGMASTTVAKATTATTAAGPASGTAGTAISAASISSALSGGVSPGGTLTFTVFGPQASAPATCTSGGTTVDSGVTVNANATYNPGTGYTPPRPAPTGGTPATVGTPTTTFRAARAAEVWPRPWWPRPARP